jgi:hypothetical protein
LLLRVQMQGQERRHGKTLLHCPNLAVTLNYS